MPAALQERLIRLWASPQGAVKAATAVPGIGLMAMDRDLGRILQAGAMTIGQTSVAWEGNKPVVTYRSRASPAPPQRPPSTTGTWRSASS